MSFTVPSGSLTKPQAKLCSPCNRIPRVQTQRLSSPSTCPSQRISLRQVGRKACGTIRRGMSTVVAAAKPHKVALLGAGGGIGQPLGLLLKMQPYVTELALYDVVNTKGVAADLSHCNTPVKVTNQTSPFHHTVLSFCLQHDMSCPICSYAVDSLSLTMSFASLETPAGQAQPKT